MVLSLFINVLIFSHNNNLVSRVELLLIITIDK